MKHTHTHTHTHKQSATREKNAGELGEVEKFSRIFKEYMTIFRHCSTTGNKTTPQTNSQRTQEPVNCSAYKAKQQNKD